MKMQNKKGAVFIVVTIVLSIIFIILSTLLALISTEVKGSQSFADGVKAYYVCRSSANIAYDYIIKNRDAIPGYNEEKNNTHNIFPSQDYKKSYICKWELVENNSNMIYKIISTGVYGKNERKVLAAFEFDTNDKIRVLEWRLMDP